MSFLSNLFGVPDPDPATSDAMHREIVDALYEDGAESDDFQTYFDNGDQAREYVASTQYQAHVGSINKQRED